MGKLHTTGTLVSLLFSVAAANAGGDTESFDGRATVVPPPDTLADSAASLPIQDPTQLSHGKTEEKVVDDDDQLRVPVASLVDRLLVRIPRSLPEWAKISINQVIPENRENYIMFLKGLQQRNKLPKTEDEWYEDGSDETPIELFCRFNRVFEAASAVAAQHEAVSQIYKLGNKYLKQGSGVTIGITLGFLRNSGINIGLDWVEGNFSYRPEVKVVYTKGSDGVGTGVKFERRKYAKDTRNFAAMDHIHSNSLGDSVALGVGWTQSSYHNPTNQSFYESKGTVFGAIADSQTDVIELCQFPVFFSLNFMNSKWRALNRLAAQQFSLAAAIRELNIDKAEVDLEAYRTKVNRLQKSLGTHVPLTVALPERHPLKSISNLLSVRR